MGVVQAAKLPVAEPGPSRRHSKLELDSLELKLKLGSLFEVGPWGPESTWVWGAAVSTVNERLAGVRSVFWAESVARTSKRWAPSERGEVGVGLPGARAGTERGRVEAAFVALGAAGRRKAEARGRVVGRTLGPGVDLGLGRGGVDRELAAGRGLVGVLGRVGGAHLERVGSV